MPIPTLPFGSIRIFSTSALTVAPLVVDAGETRKEIMPPKPVPVDWPPANCRPPPPMLVPEPEVPAMA